MKGARGAARLLVAGLLAAAVLLASGCGGGSGPRPTRVLAAASLTAAFEDLAQAFRREHPGALLELSFAGTQQLVAQVREGAPAAVFASADLENAERVVATGRARSEPVPFAANRLAVVTAPGNPGGVRGLADLGRDDLVVLLCGPSVPAGRYARQALLAAGLDVRSRSDEPSVKAVVSKVALGEADAGVVYVTDAVAAGDAVGTVAVPRELSPRAVYPILLLDDGEDDATARAFVDFVLSEAGQAVLERHGFEAP